MVEISVAGSNLLLIVEGLDKLWTFKSSLEVPLAHVKDAYSGSSVSHSLSWLEFRAPGMFVPGVLAAGTYYQDDKVVFWDVHNAEKSVAIELHDDRYNMLVVEVADPEAAISLIKGAISAA